MKLRAAGKTHIGLKRRVNEDSLLVDPGLGLFIVADGVGGHKAGDVASRMVVEAMAEYWRRVRDNDPPAFLETAAMEIPDPARHLLNSVHLANMMVHEAQKRPEYRRMGSTMAAMLVEKDCLWAANVGDSRTYHFGPGGLTQISQDHSVQAEQRALGLAGTLDPMRSGMKNMLTRVMGQNEKVEVYISPVRPDSGDTLVICSDGLTDFMTESAIGAVLKDFSTSLEEKVDVMIQEANRAGGGDNVSVILLEILEQGAWGRLKEKLKR